MWRRPKFAVPEMLTAGPVRSLGGASSRLRVTWRRVSFSVLAERFRRRFRASVWSGLRRAVPRLTSLMPAHVPRVVARDLVEAVARGQECPGPGPVVEADEHVRRVVTGSEEPGPDAGPRIAGGVEARVDGGDGRRGDGDDAGRVEARLLEVGEQEGAVASTGGLPRWRRTATGGGGPWSGRAGSARRGRRRGGTRSPVPARGWSRTG